MNAKTVIDEIQARHDSSEQDFVHIDNLNAKGGEPPVRRTRIHKDRETLLTILAEVASLHHMDVLQESSDRKCEVVEVVLASELKTILNRTNQQDRT